MSKRKKGVKTQIITITVEASTPRNLLATHPLMKKGGVHEKTQSAKRTASRRETRRMAREWGDFHQSLCFV